MDRVCRCLQRRHRSAGVARIPLGDLTRKGGKANIKTLFFQLLMTTARPLLGAGCQEDFEPCLGENDRAHIAAIGYQSRRPCELSLARKECFADFGHCRDAGSRRSGLFAAQIPRDLLPVEEHTLLTAGVAAEVHLHLARQALVAGNIVGWGGPCSISFSLIRESECTLLEEQFNDFIAQGSGEELMFMTPEEVRVAINKYLDLGPDFIKYGGTSHFSPAFIGFSPDVQKVIVDETHKRGLVAETHRAQLGDHGSPFSRGARASRPCALVVRIAGVVRDDLLRSEP